MQKGSLAYGLSGLDGQPSAICLCNTMSSDELSSVRQEFVQMLAINCRH